MNRKQFVESLGATCRNWRWSWSFVNESERFVVFGAWDRETAGAASRIFSEEWETSRAGRRQPAYSESREHLRLVEEEGFRLYTFPMEYSDRKEGDAGEGPASMASFTPEINERALSRISDSWYALSDDWSQRPAEEVASDGRFVEGAVRTVRVNTYERSSGARRVCLDTHGYACAVCGFDFEKTYGAIGSRYIHVHHVVPIASVGAEYTLDPINDLVPVCPNCHAIIHRTEPPLTVEQLREHLGS